MIVGSLRVRLLLRQSRTLKDKRQVVRSMIDRLRNGFHVSVAEVDALDDCKIIALGVALVGESAYPVRTTLEKIVEAMRSHPVAELLDHEIEV
jgi:uncharacterized protein